MSAAAGIWFVATLLGYSLSAARVFKVQPALLAVALIVLMAGCAVLVPVHGGAGAAMALLLASSVQALLAWQVLRKVRVEVEKCAEPQAA